MFEFVNLVDEKRTTDVEQVNDQPIDVTDKVYVHYVRWDCDQQASVGCQQRLADSPCEHFRPPHRLGLGNIVERLDHPENGTEES